MGCNRINQSRHTASRVAAAHPEQRLHAAAVAGHVLRIKALPAVGLPEGGPAWHAAGHGGCWVEWQIAFQVDSGW